MFPKNEKRDLLVFFCDLTKQMENVINWNLKGNFWKHTTSRATGPLCYVTFKWNWKTTLWAGGRAGQLLAYFGIPVFALWSTLILVLLAPNMSQTLNAKFIFKTFDRFFFFFYLLPLHLKFIVHEWSIFSQRLCAI